MTHATQACINTLEASIHDACERGRAGYLAMEMAIPGPFLVVVPLSTVPNWIREFRKWLPQVNALVYVGDSKSREARAPGGPAIARPAPGHAGSVMQGPCGALHQVSAT